METVADSFEWQAQVCDAMGSPFSARVCRAVIGVLDRSTATGERILGWKGDPKADALALRLMGALHALAFSGADKALAQAYPPNADDAGDLGLVIAAAIAHHDATISSWLDSPPQTNETARSSILLPGFLAIARETGLLLALNEIGSSAGLNLFPDKYRYRYGGDEWGDPRFAQTMAPDMRGAAPDLSGDLRIATRTGCDLAPVDIHSETGRIRLRAYIWPDQTQRLARLDAAIAVARDETFAVETSDAAAFVERRLASRNAQECFVLFHSLVWHYLTAETRTRMESLLNAAGAAATASNPLAWLRMELPDVAEPTIALLLTLWPGGETRQLARADAHGRWLEWLG